MPIKSHSNAIEVKRLPDENGAAAYVILSGFVNYEYDDRGLKVRSCWSFGDHPCAGCLAEWEDAGISIIVVKGA